MKEHSAILANMPHPDTQVKRERGHLVFRWRSGGESSVLFIVAAGCVNAG